jgi:hypothetical protein
MRRWPLSPASCWSRSGTCSKATRPRPWKLTRAFVSSSINSPSCLVAPCAGTPAWANRSQTLLMPCYSDAFKATILFRHESTSCSSNRFDGSYAPPNPAPLAAAGVRGGTIQCLPAAGEKTQHCNSFPCMNTCLSSVVKSLSVWVSIAVLGFSVLGSRSIPLPGIPRADSRGRLQMGASRGCRWM